MSDKLRRRSAVTAVFAAAIVFLLALPAFAPADPLGSTKPCGESACFFKEGLRPLHFIFNDVAGPEGNVWFTDSKTIAGTAAIGRITPSGEIKEYEPSGLNSEANLSGITVGPEKKLWLTDTGPNPGIVVIDPASPETATEYSTGLNAESKPEGIVTGPEGKLWFADAGTTRAIGVFDISSKEVVKECSAELNAESEPHGIVSGADGNLWFTDTGTTKAIGRVNPSTCEIKEFETGENTMPGGSPSEFGPWGIAAGADGNVWFTGAGVESSPAIGRITPSGEITKFSAGLPTTSAPLGLTTAPDGKLWFTDNGVFHEIQKYKFEGTWATGNEFELCGKAPGSETLKCSKKAYSTTLSTMRNNVKAALVAIYGSEVISTPSCAGTPISCAETFNDYKNYAQANCTRLTGTGSCKVETIQDGVPPAIGSITYTGTIQYYPLNGLESIAQVAYSGGNLWAITGGVTNEAIGKFGIEPKKLSLPVNCTGTGSGTVSPVACGSSTEFNNGEEVELTATAAEGSEFAGWTQTAGTCTGKTTPCKVTISGFENIEVTAKFQKVGAVNRRTIILTKSPAGNAGTGLGSVSSKPKGIKCAQTCNEAVGRFYKEQALVLTAAPSGETSAFDKWVGCPEPSGLVCTVPAGKADKSIEAVFKGTSKAFSPAEALTLSKGESNGYGTVKASGLTCEAECAETTVLYQGPIVVPKPKAGKTVELKEAPAFGSSFVGWSGACSGTEPTCKVEMSAAKSVTAEFADLPDFALTVEKKYEGGLGSVSSKPKGIACGTTCTSASANMPEGSSVLLTAKVASTTPATTFVKWEGGDCAGKTELTCTVGMDKAETVKAVFSGPVKTIVEPKSLTLTKEGKGFGTIKASGLTCEVLCTSATSLYYGPVTLPKPKAGAKVILKATPAPGSTTVAWSGCTPLNATECEVVMNTNASVTAKFDEIE